MVTRQLVTEAVYHMCLASILFSTFSVSQLGVRPTGDQEVVGSTPPGRQHSFVEIDHEIQSFSPFRWFKKGSWRKNVHNTG